MMKRLLLQLALGAGLLLPTLALAQEKPSLNTGLPAPATPAPTPATPAPPTVTPEPAQAEPAAPAATTPALPTPSYSSPSGFELPQREQARKAAEQHSEMYSKLFIYSGFSPGYVSDAAYGYSQLSLGISPAIGYRLNDRVSVGPGITYTYNNYGFDTSVNTTQHISTNTLGFKLFGQVMVYKQFFAHAEYETTKAEIPVLDRNYNIVKASYQVNSLLAGAGYRSQISNRVAADILLLYNFNDNYNSLYHNPVVRFNFLFNIGR